MAKRSGTTPGVPARHWQAPLIPRGNPSDRPLWVSGLSHQRTLAEEVAESWEAFVLPVYIMEGCEPFVVTIGRNKNSKEWSGRGFTKTQYAKNFFRAHFLATSLLDLCDRSGILDEVSDERNYWETRDLSVLTDEIDSHREAVDALRTAFKKAAEELDDIEVEDEAVDDGKRKADDLPSFE